MSVRAVLLDAGGVLVLPSSDHIAAAFERALVPFDPQVVDRAHYEGAVCLGPDVEADFVGSWYRYLARFVEACGVQHADRDEVHRHLDSVFADAALWDRPAPLVRDHLERLSATGVALAVVSNADGLMASRLAALGICQVGPGIGVPIATVVDSGAVGVMKPDPRIFRMALEALDVQADEAWFVGDVVAYDVLGARRAGLRPFLLDPFGAHAAAGADHCMGAETLASLGDLAEQVTAARMG